MDWLMRYLFWVAAAVVLAVGLGLYYWVEQGITEEIASLDSQCRDKTKEVEGKANEWTKLMTERHVRAVGKYQEHLKYQHAQLSELALSRKTTEPPGFEHAPERPLEFDNWLSGIRKQIAEQVRQSGLEVPPGFEATWLDEGKTTTDEKDRLQRRRKVALAQEIIRILSTTKVNVTEYVEKDSGQPPQTTELLRGVISLDGLEVLPEALRLERDQGALAMAYGSAAAAGTASSSRGTKWDEPCTATRLDVRFTAPFQVVPAVVRELESSPRWLGIVRKIDFQRATEPYGRADAGAFPASADRKDDRRSNTHYREAPVQAQVWLDLVEFEAAQVRPAKKQG